MKEQGVYQQLRSHLAYLRLGAAAEQLAPACRSRPPVSHVAADRGAGVSGFGRFLSPDVQHVGNGQEPEGGNKGATQPVHGASLFTRLNRSARISELSVPRACEQAPNQRVKFLVRQRCKLQEASVQPLELAFGQGVDVDAATRSSARGRCGQRRRISAARGSETARSRKPRSISASLGGSRLRRVARGRAMSRASVRPLSRVSPDGVTATTASSVGKTARAYPR
jgi:hypothetical protein